MTYVIDRIEGPVAVLEAPDGVMRNVPLTQLPEGVKEGDHLLPIAGKKWRICKLAAQERKSANRALLDRLAKRSP